MFTGIGYDVHQLERGENLILGGVEINHSAGLVGHSDADVVLHAISDAILGAIGEGDIGQHFPDDDPKYKGVSSLVLLEEVIFLVKKKGLALNNLDTVIIAQKPKLAPYIEQMKNAIAQVVELDISRVSVKATTTEKLGFIGKEEGIAAQAIVSIKEE